MRIPRFLTILSFAVIVFCGVSFADSTFDFSSKGNGDIGAMDTFTAGGSSITVWGFSDGSTAADDDSTHLFFKNGTGDENGLGLNDGDVDNEISGTAFIQFTAAGIKTISIGSVQSGETYQLYGSNTLGTLGTKIGSVGTADATNLNLAAIDGTWTYVSLFAPSGNVLLDNATAAAPVVPEPGATTMLMTLGVVGLLAFGRRKLFA
ncbi:MAG TPA: PEP-CTERM sorting domain-containing protein [Terriglobales bacterium]|nr:PEP-CTERM sorting domain-containing protein [Terriglobales bacterium]